MILIANSEMEVKPTRHADNDGDGDDGDDEDGDVECDYDGRGETTTKHDKKHEISLFE